MFVLCIVIVNVFRTFKNRRHYHCMQSIHTDQQTHCIHTAPHTQRLAYKCHGRRMGKPRKAPPFPVDSRSTPAFPVDSRSIPGRFPVDSRSIPVDSRSIPGRFPSISGGFPVDSHRFLIDSRMNQFNSLSFLAVHVDSSNFPADHEA